MASKNLSKQAEEVLALSSIYGDEWAKESEKTYSIRIIECKREVILTVRMPELYPTESPPEYELSAPWMSRIDKQKLHLALDQVYLDHVGEMCIFQWVERIREMVRAMKLPKSENRRRKRDVENISPDHKVKCPQLTHSGVVVDRKSSFQAHAAEVHSLEDVKAVLMRLKEHKKISNATHNIFAYCIRKGNVVLQDCEDDGEAQAGGRLLHLIQRMRVVNALVVVSRWKGTTQLGPDRFRHINSTAKQAVEDAGLMRR